MNFNDEGIIISSRKHSENSLILKILSKNHGICSCFVKIYIAKRNESSKYQIGSLVSFKFYARDPNSLGNVKIELIKSHLHNIISSKIKLDIINLVFMIIIDNSLHNDVNESLFFELLDFLNRFEENDRKFIKFFILFGIELLRIFGYKLNLSSCIVSGKKDDLYFISPKSGNSVSFEVGEEYKDKLLELPNFLKKKNNITTFDDNDLILGIKMIGFFIKKYLLKKSKLIIINEIQHNIIDFLLKK